MSLGDIEPGDGVVRHLVALPNQDAADNLILTCNRFRPLIFAGSGSLFFLSSQWISTLVPGTGLGRCSP